MVYVVVRYAVSFPYRIPFEADARGMVGLHIKRMNDVRMFGLVSCMHSHIFSYGYSIVLTIGVYRFFYFLGVFCYFLLFSFYPSGCVCNFIIRLYLPPPIFDV